MTFKPQKLGDILQFSRGFDITKKQQNNGNFPVISSGGISSYNDSFLCRGPGVVIGRKGTLGKVYFVKTNYWPHDTTLWIKDFKGNNPQYLYYLLSQLGLENFDVGASNPTLNRNHLHKIQVIFPPNIETQNKIVKVLNAYDELITINTQRINILEETACELYKEWFVRMRFPGHTQFKLVKRIPTHWKMTNIGTVINYSIGGGWGNETQSAEFNTPGYVIRGTDIPKVRHGNANKDIYRFHKASNMKSRQLMEGDIVFETAGGSEGQPLGRTCFITKELLDAYGDNVMAASFCKQIRTNSIPSLYLYYFLNYLYDTGMIETYQIQSTGISNYQFEAFLKFQQIVLPDTKLMQAFHEQVSSMRKQIVVLGLQNTQLRQIRDQLLPRLISGKLSIKNVESPLR